MCNLSQLSSGDLHSFSGGHWSKWFFMYFLVMSYSEYVARGWLGWTNSLPVVAHPCSNYFGESNLLSWFTYHFNIYLFIYLIILRQEELIVLHLNWFKNRGPLAVIQITLLSILGHKLIHITLCKSLAWTHTILAHCTRA